MHAMHCTLGDADHRPRVVADHSVAAVLGDTLPHPCGRAALGDDGVHTAGESARVQPRGAAGATADDAAPGPRKRAAGDDGSSAVRGAEGAGEAAAMERPGIFLAGADDSSTYTLRALLGFMLDIPGLLEGVSMYMCTHVAEIGTHTRKCAAKRECLSDLFSDVLE